MRKITRMLPNISFSAVLVALAFWVPGALAAGEPTVNIAPTGIVVNAPANVPNLQQMTLQVMAPNGELALDASSEDGTLSWSPMGLEDGVYRYEAVTYVEAAADDASEAQNPEGNLKFFSRAWGVVEVINGTVLVPQPGQGGDELSQTEPGVTSMGKRLVGHVLDLLIPAAQAANVTVSSTSPSIDFDDTNPVGGGGDRQIWDILTGEASIGPCTTASTDLLYRLTATGNSSIVFNICSRGSNATNTLVVDPLGDITFADGDLFIDRSSGRFGIGTTTPQYSTHIAAGGQLFLDDGATNGDWHLNPGSSGLWFINRGTATTTPVKFNAQAPSDSLVVEGTTGEIGLGTASPERQLHLVGPNAVFRMDRSANTAAFLMVRTNVSGDPLKTFVVGTNAFGPNNGEFVINDLGTAVAGPGVRRMTINTAGNTAFTGTVSAPAFITTSSQRFKENVKPLSDALSVTKQLEGVRFTWKENGSPALGLIAEDVAEVLPEVVERDANDGQLTGVNYPALVAVLVEAVKEQQRQMEAQQAEIATFRAEVAGQQAKVASLEARMADFDMLKARMAEIDVLIGAGRLQTVGMQR